MKKRFVFYNFFYIIEKKYIQLGLFLNQKLSSEIFNPY